MNDKNRILQSEVIAQKPFAKIGLFPMRMRHKIVKLTQTGRIHHFQIIIKEKVVKSNVLFFNFPAELPTYLQ